MSEAFDIKDIREEAADWLSSLHDGEPSDADMSAFDQWMNRSELHVQIYTEMSEAYYALDFVSSDSLADLMDLPSPVDNASEPEDKVVAFPERKGFPSWMRSFAVAASILAVYVFGQTFVFKQTADLVAPQGEIVMHQLDDASTVQLNTNTLVNVDLTENARHLELLKGEAYFTVAKDLVRPFTVSTEGAQVVALGTEFVVKNRGDGRIRVSVYESRVRVTHPEYLKEALVLSAGDALEFGPEISAPVVQKLASDDEIAWRQGRLIFNNTPLHEVVTTLNEYHNGRIVTSSDVAQLPISGVFQSIEPVRIMKDIVETQKLSSLKVTDRLIYVH